MLFRSLSLMHNAQIEQLIRLNMVSPIILTKYVVRSMMADGGGRIVNVASIIGFTGYSGLSVYGATQGRYDWLHPVGLRGKSAAKV